MAGIGFELRKLFRDQGLLSSIRAYGYSSLTTVGPMVLCISMILLMQWLMTWTGAAYLEQELFLATVVYCFIFSVLITGGLSLLLTRFIADMMFEKKYEHMLSSFYGAAAVCLPLGAVCAWLFLSGVTQGFGYKAATFIFFSELIVIWLQTVHLSALKDYKRIVRNFLYGVAISVLGSWLVLAFTPFKSATAVLTMMAIGFFVIVLLSARHFEEMFPPKSSRLYFSFLKYFRKYPALFGIGTFFYSGVYIHSFVYWFGPHGVSVANQYVISPFYDLPVFYAYLTIIPTLVAFVVSMETSFYEKYREYYDKILNGGTYVEVNRAKQAMQQTLMQEISFIMELQLLFTVISIALGIKLLPMIGFTMVQLDTFITLVLGYYLFIIAYIVMLLMLYFDDRKGALATSFLFVVLNAALTIWTMNTENHGFGMFIASALTLAAALARLLTYVRNIDYYTFCSRPLALTSRLMGRERGMKPPFWGQGGGKAAATVVSVLVLSVVLAACSEESGEPVKSTTPAASVVPAMTSERFIDDKRLYERDDDTSIIPLYLTIMPDNKHESDPLNWYQLNRLTSRMEEGELKVIVQEGAADGSGPLQNLFGYGTTDANAKVTIRGNSTRYASQRSYKVRLNNQAGLWRDQRVINLVKHYYDPSRLRNKLSFDLMETLPDIASLRTQFVRLYVKDLSEPGKASKSFIDYGLYTHVENPNEMFLKNHWLDPNGQLYKASMFEFFRYPEALKSQSDPSYNKEAFEKVLEIQGREDHDKLLKMLDDVNDMTISIQDVMSKHFDLDNYLTWLAVNILMDNMDTNTQNFLLYSPLNSDKWYFVPWDYDGGWELELESSSYSNGISNYWGTVLHNRFFRSQENVNLLKNKMEELYKTINNESVAQRIERYRPVVETFLRRSPDKDFSPIRTSQLEVELKRIVETPSRSIARFQEDLQKPKPIFLGDVVQNGQQLSFTWDHSFDLQGDDLYYDWSVAKDPAFTQIVGQQSNLTTTKLTIDKPKPGTYYWKVIVRDKNGNKQVAFDSYEDEKGDPYYGIRQIKVE
ncbi:exopolysaccharide Pel transporter PelG [Paenibacillus oceani]|uniref:Exopolysaccharide Pel transporter PelG n=1 Tax=Paenibacillus oceani TaxID=2772510 RepID=A0A927CDI3_9BACL|nr:exopolysaccharide Pel transporter PelG [Paenibacillus oceani]MBD2864246.1 exopolysaccharide Pel transporter PelG [Paenibacillus oceani]